MMPYRRITSINGRPTDIEATVVQNLWPQSHVSIESAHLPPEVLTDSRPCRIILDHNQMNINVIPSPDSGYLISHNTPKGSLLPVVSPVLSVNPIMKLRSARFAVANFSRFYGSTDRWINKDKSTKRSGTTILTEEPWRLQIRALPNIDSILDTIASTNGRAVTHIGEIQRTDGQLFTAGEADNLLSALRSFLSFVNGRYCSMAFAHGTDQHGHHRLIQLGMGHVEPGRLNGSLFLTVGGSDDLPIIFSGFYEPFLEPHWKEDVCSAIDWYLLSNETPSNGTVITQTALEILSRRVLESIGLVRIDEMLAENRFKTALALRDIPIEIPRSLKNLSRLAKQQNWATGIEAIVAIRNDLIHGDRKSKKFREKENLLAMVELHELGQWYVEMILLSMFRYEGRYRNRIARFESPISVVPWAHKPRVGYLETLRRACGDRAPGCA